MVIKNRRITEEEINKIYHIEYMISSNWDQGYNREIWILDIKDGMVERSLYIGDPLVPEYSEYNRRPTLDSRYQEELKENEMVFSYNFPYEGEIFDFLLEEGLDKAPLKKSMNRAIDVEIIDAVVCVNDNNEKKEFYYLYYGYGLPALSKLFEVIDIDCIEHVTYNNEMIESDSKKLPGRKQNY